MPASTGPRRPSNFVILRREHATPRIAAGIDRLRFRFAGYCVQRRALFRGELKLSLAADRAANFVFDRAHDTIACLAGNALAPSRLKRRGGIDARGFVRRAEEKQKFLIALTGNLRRDRRAV